MGLKMTLDKKNNSMGMTFEDAYWVVEELRYEMGSGDLTISFNLSCYPSRESSKMTGKDVESLSFGSPERSKYNGRLYSFSHLNYARVIFPDGVPMDRDSQLTQIYNFIKEYTGLPFEDVFEDAEIEVEPAHEEPAPEPETPEESEIVSEPEPESAPEVEPEPTPEPEPETYNNPLSL